jgi:mannosyltransferase
MSAERSVPSLLKMLTHVDAVHGTYYLFLHYWILVFGTSEAAVRLPSALAAGVMVAGTFVLGRMLVNRNVGIVAAIIAAVLPRTIYMGGDARSYALSTAIAVWLTIALLVLLRHPFSSTLRARVAWIAYAVGLAIGMYVFLYLALMIVVHAGYVWLTRENRGNRRRWTIAAVIAAILALPIIGFGYGERGQIAFLAQRGYATSKSVLVTQWFGNPYLAAAAWTLIAVVVVVSVVRWRRTHSVPRALALGMLWLVIPTVALLALNTVTPAYNLRYVSFSIPAVALVLALGVSMIPRRALQLAAVVLLVALAVPTDIGEREPYAKDGGSDWTQVSAIIAQDARPGDAIVFDRTTKPSLRPRLAMHLYPSAYKGLVDVTLKTPYLARSGLWDTTYPLSAVGSRLDGISHVWVVEVKGSPDNVNDSDIHTLEGDGYYVVSRQLVHRSIIYSLAKSA